jgi:maleate isomerase
MNKKIKFGLIVPSGNNYTEPDFYSLRQEDIGIYTTRIFLEKVTPEELEKMGEKTEEAAKSLSNVDADIILFGCTTGSLVEGLEWEENLKRRITNIAGVPAITTAGSIVNALKIFDVRKIIIFTPYSEALNKREIYFLENLGFQILELKGLDIVDNPTIASVTSDEIYKNCIELYQRNLESQALFISCTNLDTFDIIDRIEKETNIPVITSNQASYWALLRTIGDTRKIKGAGKLLEDY